ncbi:hypothetical protein DFJ74DRAFT_660110 [Hyaloraphidium curvatum]|nr:hypothetical protein DFJ74DRAFT_660110 [Hyaloraphidium curvatum]
MPLALPLSPRPDGRAVWHPPIRWLAAVAVAVCACGFLVSLSRLSDEAEKQLAPLPRQLLAAPRRKAIFLATRGPLEQHVLGTVSACVGGPATGVEPPVVGDPRSCPSLGFGICNVHKHIPLFDTAMPPFWKASASWNSVWHDPQAASCHFSDAYRFIMVKMAKAGSSSMGPGFLRPAVCPVKAGESGRSVFFHAPFSESCTETQYTPLDSDYYACHRIPRHKWLQYYVFTSVRDPIDRAASSFNYCGKTIAVQDWCRNPDAGGGLCSEGNITDAPNVHWAAQTGSICDAHSRSCIVDYVVRVESLAADMDAVVHSINAGRNMSYPALPLYSARNVRINAQADHPDPQKVQEAEARANGVVKELDSEPCAGALMDWYGPDFDLLGYVRPGRVCEAMAVGDGPY